MRRVGIFLLWLLIALCMAAAILPHYLDRIYHRGEAGPHFDGARFFNPTGPDTSAPPTGGSRAGMFLRMLGLDDQPVWPTSVAVTKDVPPARVTGGAMRATWVGHATVLVQADGINILTDPVWSDIAGPFGLLGPRRVSPPGIDFDRLPRIDLVLVSHNHYDHLDIATLKRLWDRDRPYIVTSLGNDALMRSAGIAVAGQADANRLVALDWDGGLSISHAFDVFVTRNHHWSSRWITDRNRALWSSFVVRLPSGNVFFAGDTGAGDYRWADEALRHGPIRLAILPIGAFRFREGQMETASHVGPAEAIKLWNRLGRPATLPIHWGTFRLSWEGHDTPPRMLTALQACAGERSGRFVPRAIGAAWDVPRPAAVPPVATARIDRCLSAPAVTRLR